MKEVITFLFAFSLLAAFGQETAVQSDSTDTLNKYVGDELTVWENRFIASPLLKYVVGETISDSLILKSHSERFDEILQSQTGIYVKQGQIPGTSITPMLAGGGLAHQKFLLDGIPIALPQMMQYDLSTQPLWSLGAMEIIPGSHSSLYGTGGMAGAFNLITPWQFPDGAITRVEIAQGDYNTDWLAVGLSHNLFKRVMMHISGTKLDVDGDQSNEHTRSENLSAKIFVPIYKNWNIETYAQSHRGWLDYYSFGSLGHQRDDDAIGAFHINGGFGKYLLRASTQLERYDQKYYTDFSSSHHEGDVLTFDLRTNSEFGRFTPTIFVQSRSYNLKSTNSGEHNLTTFATGFQSDMNSSLIDGLISARIDKDIQDNILPSFGLGIKKELADSLSIMLSAGMGFRSPSPNDLWYYEIWGLYSEPITDSTGDTTGWDTISVSGSRGDENLESEHSMNLSLTTKYNKGFFDVSILGFYTKYENLIEWQSEYIAVADGPDSSLYVSGNVNAATIAGATISTDIELAKWLKFGAKYTYTSAKDSSGEKLVERPEHFLASNFTTKYSFWDNELEFGLRLEPSFISNIGRTKYDIATYQSYIDNVSPEFIIGGRFWARYKDFEFFALGENLTDNKYELPDGETALGKYLRFGISWNFRD
ncbi:TonB-dependent receptor [bacterium]|nr:TonB-dependent receptor [bacterium]